ncbi:MAG: isochorismatase family cysteine hydrolase [Candidatus Acidiferrales bacterium]
MKWMENQTISKDVIFWEVDAQEDFMKPGGKLYVPGAEKLLPNLRRLTNAARQGRVFLVSHGCIHAANDPEFAQFPPHCIRGSAGAKFVPEAMTDKFVTIPNESGAKLPENLAQYQQIVLEKQTLDIFQSSHAESLLARLPRDAEFIVFGVVTEYCVRLAAKGLLERGCRVSVVRDAIETLNPEESKRTLEELKALGATLIATDDALNRVGALTQPIQGRSSRSHD